VLWFLLCREFRPGSFLEIGVFRGQTLSLVSLMSKRLGFRCEVAGISPFLPAGDSVSNYRSDIDYFADTQSNFSHFGLRSPGLCRAFSTDPEASEFAASRQWDCIYIDGNHDYSVASSDWQLCCKLLSTNGIIVLDDSALETSYRPPAFATAGHPGPSRLAKEIQSSQPQFSEILRVGHNRVFQHLG